MSERCPKLQTEPCSQVFHPALCPKNFLYQICGVSDTCPSRVLPISDLRFQAFRRVVQLFLLTNNPVFKEELIDVSTLSVSEIFLFP